MTVSAHQILRALPTGEVVESRFAARLRAARHTDAEMAFRRYVADAAALLSADAAEHALEDALRRDRHERLELLDATVRRCPVDGAWTIEGRPCSCCCLRLPS